MNSAHDVRSLFPSTLNPKHMSARPESYSRAKYENAVREAVEMDPTCRALIERAHVEALALNNKLDDLRVAVRLARKALTEYNKRMVSRPLGTAYREAREATESEFSRLLEHSAQVNDELRKLIQNHIFGLDDETVST